MVDSAIVGARVSAWKIQRGEDSPQWPCSMKQKERRKKKKKKLEPIRESDVSYWLALSQTRPSKTRILSLMPSRSPQRDKFGIRQWYIIGKYRRLRRELMCIHTYGRGARASLKNTCKASQTHLTRPHASGKVSSRARVRLFVCLDQSHHNKNICVLD